MPCREGEEEEGGGGARVGVRSETRDYRAGEVAMDPSGEEGKKERNRRFFVTKGTNERTNERTMCIPAPTQHIFRGMVQCIRVIKGDRFSREVVAS